MHLNLKYVKGHSRKMRNLIDVVSKRIHTVCGKTVNLLITEDNYDFVKSFLIAQFGDRLAFIPPKQQCVNSYIHFQETVLHKLPVLMIDRSSQLHGSVMEADDFFFFNKPWWNPDEIRLTPKNELVFTSSKHRTDITFIGDINQARFIVPVEVKWDGVESTDQLTLIYSKQGD